MGLIGVCTPRGYALAGQKVVRTDTFYLRGEQNRDGVNKICANIASGFLFFVWMFRFDVSSDALCANLHTVHRAHIRIRFGIRQQRQTQTQTRNASNQKKKTSTNIFVQRGKVSGNKIKDQVYILVTTPNCAQTPTQMYAMWFSNCAKSIRSIILTMNWSIFGKTVNVSQSFDELHGQLHLT